MCHFVYDHPDGTSIYLSFHPSLTPLQIFFPRSYEQEAGYRYRERPMTELWSDDDDKTQLAEGMGESYRPTMAYHEDATSRMDMQDPGPYVYHPQYNITSSGSSPNSNLNAGVDDDTTFLYTRRAPHSAAPALDPQDHPHDLPDPTALRSPPPPERSTARRSRAPVWEVVSADHDDPQVYYVGNPGGAIVRNGPNTGVTDLSRSPTKSNLHPILQNFSSPISTCPFR